MLTETSTSAPTATVDISTEAATQAFTQHMVERKTRRCAYVDTFAKTPLPISNQQTKHKHDSSFRFTTNSKANSFYRLNEIIMYIWVFALFIHKIHNTHSTNGAAMVERGRAKKTKQPKNLWLTHRTKNGFEKWCWKRERERKSMGNSKKKLNRDRNRDWKERNRENDMIRKMRKRAVQLKVWAIEIENVYIDLEHMAL